MIFIYISCIVSACLIAVSLCFYFLLKKILEENQSLIKHIRELGNDEEAQD